MHSDVSPVSRRNLLIAALTSCAAKLLRAQAQSNPPTTFSSSVDVVNVFATVHDKSGKIVSNLSKEDFELQEDDRPQNIKYFSRQTDLPLTVGLLLDTSGSERRMIGQEKDASRTFLENVLRPKTDKAFLIHFDHEVELLQDLTDSRDKLEKALDQLDRPQLTRSGSQPDASGTGTGDGSSQPDDPDARNGGSGGYGRRGGYGGRGGGRGAGAHAGTQLYDAIYLAASDVLKGQTGRKAIILLTDGEDHGSKVSLSEAISAAQRSDTLVYSIHVVDEERGSSPFGGFGGPGMGRHGGMGGPGGGMGRGGGGPYGGSHADGKKILQQLSRETGGGYFEFSKKKTVGDIYVQIEEELRNQYSIGYTSDQPNGDGAYRNIKLTAKDKKNLVVQARQGYYATPKRT